MQSLILIALFQAAMGEPAQQPAVEPTTAEAPAAAPAPRTERRRVCQEHGGSTGQRLSVRRCRWEEVLVEPEAEEVAEEAAVVEERPLEGGAPVQGAQSPGSETP